MHRLARARSAQLVSLSSFALVATLTGCPSKDENRSAPPPPQASAPSAGSAAAPSSAGAAPAGCASGGGEIGDARTAAFFPRSAGGYCVDPQGETKTFGESAKHPREDVCVALFDGECEVYFRYKLARVVALRYVDGAGKGSSVEVHLSQFADPGGAYGMFTKRVIADSDPADESAPKPLQAGGAGAIGTGTAYVWKGAYLIELAYNNEQESPEALARSSGAILPVLGKEIAAKLPGAPDKPAAARALPDAKLISPIAIAYAPKDALGVAGFGPAAVGYYRDAAARWRMVSYAGASADEAKDAMKALRSRPEALPVTGAVAGAGEEGAHVMIKEGDKKTEYVFARKGGAIFGVGDDEYARAGEGAERDGGKLTYDAKLAKLKAWLSAAGPTPPASSSPPASASSAKK
jgi:hypothetical protein